MQRIESSAEMQKWALSKRGKGQSIAFVPTMGFLHEGHLELMRIGKKKADLLVASIFVNPKQFNDTSDLDSYPSDEEGDLEKLRSVGCDLVFFPPADEIYPADYRTEVTVSELNNFLCGRTRPGHFEGVTTVVSKLFNIVQPTLAVFGEKDFQQLSIIQRMTKDLNFPIEIIAGATYREADGLAMSSRNARLTKQERAEAPTLRKALKATKQAFKNGEKNSQELIQIASEMIIKNTSGTIDYIEIVDADRLQTMDIVNKPSVMALAVNFTKSRLIDNIRL